MLDIIEKFYIFHLLDTKKFLVGIKGDLEADKLSKLFARKFSSVLHSVSEVHHLRGNVSKIVHFSSGKVLKTDFTVFVI